MLKFINLSHKSNYINQTKKEKKKKGFLSLLNIYEFENLIALLFDQRSIKFI